MNIDPAAILALISSLTAQVAQLEQENAALRERLQPEAPPEPSI